MDLENRINTIRKEADPLDLFCGLLSEQERETIFALLVEYKVRLDHLSAFIVRAQEQKLVLSLTRNRIITCTKNLQIFRIYSFMLGCLIGGIAACVLLCLV